MPLTYRVAHTFELEPALLEQTRSLLQVVFAGELRDEDWEHSLGGIHAIALNGQEPVGHASVVQRRMINAGRCLRTAYVEGVGVHAAWQRKGIATELMVALERVIRGAYDLGVLGATDEAVPLYSGRGWKLWRGPLSALTPRGIVPTPEEQGGIWVLAQRLPLDLDSELTCDWRDGDVW